jgi:hypothetical protein
MSDNQPTFTEQTLEEKRKQQERLSEALRANLKRRKTQSRARKSSEESEKEKS